MRFHAGEIIPFCSDYLVIHVAHQGITVVIGAAGDTFPPCKTCGTEVSFELVSSTQNSRGQLLANHPEFRFPLLKTMAIDDESPSG